MGSFFGPPIRVGIPIGISAGFGHAPGGTPTPPAGAMITEVGDVVMTDESGTTMVIE